MEQNQFIANRLREVFLNGTWIANTNYKKELEATTYKQAIQKVGNLNTIAVLTYHINYYLSGLLRVLNGGPLDISDKYSFDAPVLQTDAEWKALVAKLLENAEAFSEAVAQLPDAILNTPFVTEKYGTYNRNLEGVIEHSYYHLGQIVLIKKLVGDSAL